MEAKLVEIAMRIRELREILEITPEQAAQATNTSVEEYLSCESGQKDFSFTFLYQCAKLFGVDMVELVTGENPRLSFYSIVRKDEGLPIKRRAASTISILPIYLKTKPASHSSSLHLIPNQNRTSRSTCHTIKGRNLTISWKGI